MKIVRDGVEFELTEKELESLYWEACKLHMRDEVRCLLEENEYPEQDKEMLMDITETYLDWMESSERLGELEHEVFSRMMKWEYPEIQSEEE